jgi:hypothetical protein
MGDDVNTNLSDTIYGYVNSQLNELSYMEPVIKFQESQGGINAAKNLNKQGANEAKNYMAEMLKKAITPESKSGMARVGDKIRSNVYQNILRGNVKIGLQNYTQRFIAKSEVSGQASRLANSLTKEERALIGKDLAFGDATVSGATTGTQAATGTKGALTKAIDKIDPYARSEKTAVRKPYEMGYVQGIMDTPAYKEASDGGAKPKDALRTAMQDPAAHELAVRRGNVNVNNTAFGANSFARPAMLQDPKVFGSSTAGKALTMFVRFPIGMSQHVIEQLQQNSTRAVDMFRYGDPRGVPLAEMRDNYKALQGIMKDNATAKNSKIPPEVLKEQIKVLDNNVKVIDNEIKSLSQRRGGKSAANLTKMWAAAAAINYMFDAGGSLLSGEENEASVTDAMKKADPTVVSSLTGTNSRLGALTSPLSPVNKYGQFTSRPVLNAIPGAGVANRLSGNAISDWLDGKKKEE